MKVSARVDYACRALLELSRYYDAHQVVPLKQIIGDDDMPAQFLVQILLQLKSAGLIRSTRGAAGGYRLARCPSTISLGNVVTAMEGTASESDQQTTSPFARCLQRTWDELAEERAAKLNSTTLQELLEEARDESTSMYYI